MKILTSTFFFCLFFSFTFAQYRVAILDASYRDVVYDYSVYKNGGTNATEIAEIISNNDDISKIRIFKTSARWLSNYNVQKVADFDPDLVIIHTSAFYNPMNPGSTQVYDYLLNFLGRLNYETYCQVLVYSRNYFVQGGRRGLESIILRNIPGLRGDLKLITIGSGSFLDSSDRSYMRRAVGSML